MEFESSEQKNAPRSHVCVVYDPRDGRIVHGHEFVGGGAGLFDPDGREERDEEVVILAADVVGPLVRVEVEVEREAVGVRGRLHPGEAGVPLRRVPLPRSL